MAGTAPVAARSAAHPAGGPGTSTQAPVRAVPDVSIVVDRIVLEDPSIDPGRAERIREAVRERVTRLLQQHRFPADAAVHARSGVTSEAGPGPGAGDEELAEALARAIVASLGEEGPHGPA